MSVAPNASELFCMTYLSNIERFFFFFTILTFYFKRQILHACKLASLSLRKSARVRDDEFSFGNERN